jgi:hypothetical protein
MRSVAQEPSCCTGVMERSLSSVSVELEILSHIYQPRTHCVRQQKSINSGLFLWLQLRDLRISTFIFGGVL